MKRLLSLSAIITTFLVLTNTISAQTGNPTALEVFHKYIEAVGGRAAIEKATSRVIKGTVELKPAGVTGTFEVYSKAPNKNLTLLNLTGIGEIFDGFDGTEGWGNNPIQGKRVKDGEELEDTKTTSDFYYDTSLEKYYPKAVVSGSDKVDNIDVYVVKGDESTTFYFDKQTGLLLRTDRISVSPEGKVPTQTFLSDYREFEGLKLPYGLRQVVQGMEFVMKVEDVKQNVAIEDAKFSKPK